MSKGLLISGFAKSGKDTFADMVIEQLKENQVDARGYYLAFKLKKACCVITGLGMEHMTDQSLKEVPFKEPFILTNEHLDQTENVFKERVSPEVRLRVAGTPLISPRQVMQFLGTEVMRHSSPDIHCIKTMDVINKEKPQVFLITDCRFFNELDFFGPFDKLFIKRSTRIPEYREDLHPSEKTMFEIMKILPNISNDGTLEELRQKATEVSDKILKELK